MRLVSPVVLAFLAALATVAQGCSHHIGDTCNTNVDCSPLGDRFCDVASPSGYCTIEGCDVRLDNSGNRVDSCQAAASESVCVRFFSLIACKPCDPADPGASCAADENCLCDNADPCNVRACLTPPVPAACSATQPVCQCPSIKPEDAAGKLGHCTKQSSERRWCMLKCNSDGDCRGNGYYCVQAGTNGAEPVPQAFAATDAGLIGVGNYAQKFCVYTGTKPQPPPSSCK